MQEYILLGIICLAGLLSLALGLGGLFLGLLLFAIPFYVIRKKKVLFVFLVNVLLFAVVLSTQIGFNGKPRYLRGCGVGIPTDFSLFFDIPALITDAIYPNIYVQVGVYGLVITHDCGVLTMDKEYLLGRSYEEVKAEREAIIRGEKLSDEKAISQRTEKCKRFLTSIRNFNPYLYIANAFIFYGILLPLLAYLLNKLISKAKFFKIQVKSHNLP